MIGIEALNDITERLVGRFHPEKIILFGSQARGTAENRSDVDILVVSHFEGKRQAVMLEMDKALEDLDYAFDVLVSTPEEFERDRRIPGTVSRYADKEGKVLYGTVA